MEILTSRNNRWIKLAMQLKQKKYRDKTSMFLMEGIRSAEDAQVQNIKDVVCLIAGNKLQEGRISNIVKRGGELHWLFLQAEEELIQLISDTEHGQGLILIIPKQSVGKEVLIQGLKGKYIYLDMIQDPGNVGTIIRTAAAAGCHGVLLSEGCADPYSEKVVRSSMGSILRIPIYEGITIPFLLDLKNKSSIPFIGTSLTNAKPYSKKDAVEEALFIFGNEGNGVRKEILEMADWNIFIPLSGTVESLNVSSAAAVILFTYFM